MNCWINKNDYLIYEKEVRLHVPWRWMAPEYLNARYFTDTSDVWSFGVLFWEILSLGRIPYGHQGYDEVAMNLKTGYRLPCPDGLEYITLWRPEKLYESISKTCFIANPNKRGTFSDVVQILRSDLTEEEALFHDQMTEHYKSKLKVDVEGLIGKIGGLLGIMLGFSFIKFVDMFEQIWDLISYIFPHM